MFTIQYKAVDGTSKMQSFDSKSRTRLAAYLSRFEYPILAVYEQASPITKAMRNEIRTLHVELSRAAREFAFMSQV